MYTWNRLGIVELANLVQFAGGVVMTRAQLINALGMRSAGTTEADMPNGTARSETIKAPSVDSVVMGRAGDDIRDKLEAAVSWDAQSWLIAPKSDSARFTAANRVGWRVAA